MMPTGNGDRCATAFGGLALLAVACALSATFALLAQPALAMLEDDPDRLVEILDSSPLLPVAIALPRVIGTPLGLATIPTSAGAKRLRTMPRESRAGPGAPPGGGLE